MNRLEQLRMCKYHLQSAAKANAVICRHAIEHNMEPDDDDNDVYHKIMDLEDQVYDMIEKAEKTETTPRDAGTESEG